MTPSHRPQRAPVSAAPHLPLWLWGFIALLVLLPLPFGANRDWASALMGVISGGLFLFMLWEEKDAPPWQGAAPRKRILGAALGFSIVILWGFIQTLPWTPTSWHHPIWIQTKDILGPVSSAISVDPSIFIESLSRLLSYIVFFLMAFCAGRNNAYAKQIVKALAWAGTFYAFYGLLAYASGAETILWFKKWAYHTFLTSTFVNKNSYAAYAGIGLLCSLALVRDQMKHIVIRDRLLAQKSKMLAYLDSLSFTQIVVLLIPILLIAALALTGSRAGTASSFFGVLTLLVALAVNMRMRSKKGMLISIAVLGAFLFFVLLGGQTLMTRFDGENLSQDTSIRLAGYSLALQAISDNPWLGFGLGTFDSAFRLYRDASLSLWYHHAHNDYLEMLMDLGIPVASILFLSLGLLVSCCASGVWERKRGAIYPALGLGASALIAAHSLVDFSMHIPAIAATYATLLGLGVAQSWSSRNK